MQASLSKTALQVATIGVNDTHLAEREFSTDQTCLVLFSVSINFVIVMLGISITVIIACTGAPFLQKLFSSIHNSSR